LSGVYKNELKKVPYIDYIPSDGRIVFLQPYLDKADNKFKTFVPQGKKLTLIFAEPVESCYYAESVIDETNDIYLRLIDTIARYYLFDSVIHTMLGIIRDIENCGIVVEKYFIFLDLYRNTKDVLTSNLITTDLEHFFGNVRSIYDLLQSLIRDLWRRTSRKKLHDNFSRMVKLGTERLRNRIFQEK